MWTYTFSWPGSDISQCFLPELNTISALQESEKSKSASCLQLPLNIAVCVSVSSFFLCALTSKVAVIPPALAHTHTLTYPCHLLLVTLNANGGDHWRQARLPERWGCHLRGVPATLWNYQLHTSFMPVLASRTRERRRGRKRRKRWGRTWGEDGGNDGKTSACQHQLNFQRSFTCMSVVMKTVIFCQTTVPGVLLIKLRTLVMSTLWVQIIRTGAGYDMILRTNPPKGNWEALMGYTANVFAEHHSTQVFLITLWVISIMKL